VVRADANWAKDHGYAFEVPAIAEPKLAPPVPLKAMGRFNHEAVAVHPATSFVYETEDQSDGLLYRFIPNQPQRLAEGGKLQALCVIDQPSLDTRNWDERKVTSGAVLRVKWLDLEDIEAPNDDLRLRGFAQGAARFARGEGAWYGNDAIYFACTNGGRKKKGQIWRYVPSPFEGTSEEQNDPGKLELFVEPNDGGLVDNADNLTVAPWGDLIVCEDGEEEQFLVGVTPKGEFYKFAHNAMPSSSELAGVTFSPDGTTLFVNIQHEGLTLAITGPWRG
ncbi:MAG: alkaline phosphatase PhoX, partial [bacterium]